MKIAGAGTRRKCFPSRSQLSAWPGLPEHGSNTCQPGTHSGAAAQENMEHFAGLLQKRAGLVGPAPENTEELSMLAENVSAWEEKIRLHFPGTETDRRKLDFYSFPGISFAELFQRLFHLEGEAAAKKQLNPTALLAILTP